ncbi:MAG: uracil-DNA glycosylase [Heliobacteriaceae bacterium]|nr:uracil-DNA glycosylase [Heliobacteriaceae bacterium]MDD4588174.1 uracil-DNA glycosylase [Heliobacteriaceae bacterium]
MAGRSELAAYEQAVKECVLCGLRNGCRQVVFGEGDPASGIMFVGEGPGAQEDRLGRPFVGAAGQLLDRILAAAHLPRLQVYITNIVKCRPPGNRLPLPLEVKACRCHLDRQLQIINPQIIVCLGALATKSLVDAEAQISRVRGIWFQRDGRLIMPTYHPAALLRDPAKKRPVWEDIQRVMVVYRGEKAEIT